ncbi:MAG: hypothetical protein RIQ93_96 [Verrucomicrobiota bacterium]|jgi:hypothetical protein
MKLPLTSRRSRLATLLLTLVASAAPAFAVESAGVTDIGSRREVFVEDTLVERLAGKAELRLQQPTPRELVIVHDAPWEGPGSGYHSLFKDGDLYRMYYKAWQRTRGPGSVNTDANPLLCCYAESNDGIHWRKPQLGLHEFNGSKANNIVMVTGKVGQIDADAGHPAVFKDENPNASPDARYKAILRSRNPRGLLAFKSADAIHWSPLTDAPIITDGAFDSQNLAFWDGVRGEYRAYWRYFQQGVKMQDDRNPAGVRAIRTATSKDFIHWENQADLKYVDSPSEQLYTNQIKPYARAPHVLIGFPMRYTDRGWSEAMRALPNADHRTWRATSNTRLGTALSDALFMASRDGVTFKRWSDAFLRPGIERDGTWSYGQQCVAWQVVETKSSLEGAPNELSIYADEFYWSGAKGSAVRRYTLRLDGFVSVHAPMSGGELVTKPLRFTGRELHLNFATSAAGSVRVEIQDASGRALPGFALEDCPPLFGDTVARAVTWRAGAKVSALANQPVRPRFSLQDADVYAYQFIE